MAFKWQSKCFLLHEEPVKPQEEQEHPARHHNGRCSGLDGSCYGRIALPHRLERAKHPNAWICEEHNERRQNSTHHKDSKENTPYKKETLGTLAFHRSKHVGIDDRVVDTGYDLKNNETDDDQKKLKHVGIIPHPI